MPSESGRRNCKTWNVQNRTEITSLSNAGMLLQDMSNMPCPWVPCPRMTESHLSPQAYDRLRQELEERTTTRRREISLWIERAREHGDISENADYDAAKNEQGHNEARVRQLEAMLKSAVVVAAASGEVVEPGCLVELRYQGDDDQVTYLVGSIEERHETYDVLSTNSPLGQALLGAAPGQTVTYQGPKRELSVTVVDVRPLS